MNNNIYKKAKKNFDKKSNFARKFNKDNNLKYGNEGFIDCVSSDNMTSGLEREANILAIELENMSAYTVHSNVEGIKSKQLSEGGEWYIEDYTNRKERIQFMISILQKELKKYKD